MSDWIIKPGLIVKDEDFDHKSRVELIKNNENFFLTEKEIKELLEKKVAIGNRKLRHLTYRTLISHHAQEARDMLEKSSEELVRTDWEGMKSFDGLLLYANYSRILSVANGITVSDDRKFKTTYNRQKLNTKSEIVEFMTKGDYVIIDLETTGFGKMDQMTQFGLVGFEQGTAKVQAEFYVEKYKIDIPKDVIALTGITNEKILAEGKDAYKVANAVYQLLHGRNVLAHNCRFDMDKVVEFFIDLRLAPPEPLAVYDTIDMFKTVVAEDRLTAIVKSYSLDNLTKVFSSDGSIADEAGRHTAMFDILWTRRALMDAIHYREKQAAKEAAKEAAKDLAKDAAQEAEQIAKDEA